MDYYLPIRSFMIPTCLFFRKFKKDPPVSLEVFLFPGTSYSGIIGVSVTGTVWKSCKLLIVINILKYVRKGSNSSSRKFEFRGILYVSVNVDPDGLFFIYLQTCVNLCGGNGVFLRFTIDGIHPKSWSGSARIEGLDVQYTGTC